MAEHELRRVMAERTPARFEVFYELRGRWFETDAYPTRDGGIAAYARDVSERKRAEERLRESEERLRKMFQVETVGVIFFDRSGTLIEANEAFLRLTGYTRGDVQARQLNWQTLTPPEWREVSAERMKEFEATGHIGPYEKEYFRKDGSRSWLLFAGSSLGDGTIVKFCIDVTDRKQAEEALREADRRKDEFLAMLAHELRNPLAPLRTGVQILQLARNRPEAWERATGMMERQLQHMVRLIDDLLDLSRISRGKIQLRKSPADLAGIVQHAVETSRPLIAQSGHQLTVQLPAEPIVVEADVTRLAQAFANLLNNAAKYTESGGHIALTVEREQEQAVVRVKDDGIGIPSHMLGRIFEMFIQVDRTLERTQGGLGIGLSLVKGVVEMHGGSVEAHSEGQGRGTEVTVRLKALSSPLREASDDPQRAARTPARHRVLIVDDNIDAATSLALLIQLMNHEVETAHDGLEALAKAAEFRPDLILLDLGMPKLNGYDTCRRLREEPWGRNIVIVALTGWGQDEDRRRSQAAGFDHHLVKPVDPAILRQLLASL
jgi:PAS domain S-box-containing protein